MNLYQIDEFGRAVVNSEGLFELWYQGQEEGDLLVLPTPDIEEYNRQCERHAKSDYMIRQDEQPATPHSERVKRWMIPDEFKTLDVEAYCTSLCATEEERERVWHEMAIYRDRDLEPLLRSLIYMVTVFRENKIVWGIGRGSSVASFILFLIGVHHINPMKHGLKIEDFLR